jgi:sarcosine oxidase subunit beta
VPADPGFVDLVLRSRDGVGRLAPFWHELHHSLEPARFILTAGQYTMTPDHRPLIGPAPQTAGLYLNTGYSGHGIMGAPAGGRLLADIVTSQSASANRFSPARRFDDNAHHRTERMVI